MRVARFYRHVWSSSRVWNYIDGAWKDRKGRSFLIEHFAALQIDLFPRGTFPDILQDVVVVSGRRAAKTAAVRPKRPEEIVDGLPMAQVIGSVQHRLPDDRRHFGVHKCIERQDALVLQ